MGKWALLASVLVGCAADSTQTAQQYFARSAYPVLEAKCGGGASGCHAISSTDPLAAVSPPAFVGLAPGGAYDVLVQEGYAGAFTDQAPLVNLTPHAGGPLDPTTRAVIDEWFALERQDRGY